jgi:co-chaperonin GroES (HSP10)
MSIEVCGHRVLIKPDPLEEEVNGIIIVHDKREEGATVTGIVAAVGPTCWNAYDKDHPDWKPWCKIGDHIVYAKYSGKDITDPNTGDKYRLINDEDVQVVLHEEGEE